MADFCKAVISSALELDKRYLYIMSFIPFACLHYPIFDKYKEEERALRLDQSDFYLPVLSIQEEK